MKDRYVYIGVVIAITFAFLWYRQIELNRAIAVAECGVQWEKAETSNTNWLDTCRYIYSGNINDAIYLKPSSQF